MKYQEKPLIFDCAGERLLGILAQPDRSSATGVVMVVGGPQYRAGSHRHYLSLARTLAAGGYPVLRFDCRGMGDSSGEMRNFEGIGEDIAAAAGVLQAACPEVTEIKLWGLCDGASAALLYCHETGDPRIDGLVLVNPWVRSEATLARTQVRHYYGQRLLQREFWRKLLRGDLAVGQSLRGLWRTVGLSVAGPEAPPAASPSYQGRMALAWRNFPGRILLVLSGQDFVAKEFLEYARTDSAWSGLLERRNVRRADVLEADHTFSVPGTQRRLEFLALQWLQQLEREEERLAG
jgi:exosortase A-associated hydrolase 1